MRYFPDKFPIAVLPELDSHAFVYLVTHPSPMDFRLFLSDLVRLAVRSSVAVRPASIALVQEPLVIAFEFVVEDDAVHSTALFAEPLFGAEVGAIDV